MKNKFLKNPVPKTRGLVGAKTWRVVFAPVVVIPVRLGRDQSPRKIKNPPPFCLKETKHPLIEIQIAPLLPPEEPGRKRGKTVNTPKEITNL